MLAPAVPAACRFAQPCRFCCAGAIASNLRKLHAAKRAFNKHKPQAVLYIDRLDAGRRDMADLNVRPGGRAVHACDDCTGTH